MADVALTPTTEPSQVSKWARRYPPLLSLVVALLIAFLVLPSSLNLPQSNPTTVLEFAPVPPKDDTPPPPQQGSLSTLGLGSSSSLSTDVGDAATPSLKQSEGGKGTRASTKRCVGDPPRQTEDPNAPPCVPFFDGDNGGLTWQGVTKDEIVALVYRSGSISTAGYQTPASGTYCDVDKPANTQKNCLDTARPSEDNPEVTVTRAMSRYYNDRFQTYGRRVHFYIYWTGATSAASRRSDAQDNWTVLKPFAVLDRAFFGGYNDAYAEAIVRRNVSVYGTFSSLPNRYFRNNAPLIWSFWPDVEHAVAQYVSYICTKVAPFNTTFSGNANFNGKPRKYAYLSTTDPNYAGLQYFARLAKGEFDKPCPGNGIKISDSVVADVTYSRNQYQNDTHPDAPREARNNVAKLQAANATTILWLQGYETETGKAATASTYRPEWILAGDLLNDGIENGRAQDQVAFRHAWIVSNQIRQDSQADDPCRQAYREAEPNGKTFDENEACVVYRGFFMLFRGIQVAGPQLAPQSVDQGNHAIPRSASTSAFVAACFFDPGDYSCVKDAEESWWDPDAPDPGRSPDQRGCWRMVENGKRYLAGEWTAGQTAFQNRNDVCNDVDTDTFINPYGPAG